MATKTKKQTLFVVTETEFSYNDEVYSVEGSGGLPLNAFHTKEDAEAFITKSTVKWLKEMGSDNLAGHGYGIDEIFKKAPAFLSQAEQDSFMDSDTDTFETINSLNMEERSDEELAQIAAVLTFSPFSLHKISVE